MEQSLEIHAAKLNELQNWSTCNVFGEVLDNGQYCITVCWVITTKDVPINTTVNPFTARLLTCNSLKGELHTKYKLFLFERALKMLKIDICMTKILPSHSRDIKL